MTFLCSNVRISLFNLAKQKIRHHSLTKYFIMQMHFESRPQNQVVLAYSDQLEEW